MANVTSLNGLWMTFHIASVRIKKVASAFGGRILELIAPTTNQKRRMTMETTDYVSYSLALALKAAGFDEPCDHVYCKWFLKDTDVKLLPKEERNGCHICADAPTLWQAQKWLREKKDIIVTVGFEPIDDSDMVYTNTINRYKPDGGKNVWDCWDTYRSLNGCGSTYSGGWDSYEQALSAGIAAALELIEKKGE